MQVIIDPRLGMFYGAEKPAIDTIDAVGFYMSLTSKRVDSYIHDAPAFVVPSLGQRCHIETHPLPVVGTGSRF